MSKSDKLMWFVIFLFLTGIYIFGVYVIPYISTKSGASKLLGG